MATVMRATSVQEVISGALIGVPREQVVDELPETLPLVLTDRGLAERVLANIVENAVRHSPPGVPVRLIGETVPDSGVVELRVVDRGTGVSDDDKERMFEPFQRLRDAPAGSGVGLGLAVARGLAEVLGAQVAVEDTPGGGLTMVVSLPVSARATEAAGAR